MSVRPRKQSSPASPANVGIFGDILSERDKPATFETPSSELACGMNATPPRTIRDADLVGGGWEAVIPPRRRVVLQPCLAGLLAQMPSGHAITTYFVHSPGEDPHPTTRTIGTSGRPVHGP